MREVYHRFGHLSTVQHRPTGRIASRCRFMVARLTQLRHPRKGVDMNNKLTRQELISEVERVLTKVTKLKADLKRIGDMTPKSECTNSVQKEGLERLRNEPHFMECYDLIRFDYLKSALSKLKDNRTEKEITEERRTHSFHDQW